MNYIENRKSKDIYTWNYQYGKAHYWKYLWLCKKPCVTYNQRLSGLSDVFAWITKSPRYKVVTLWFDSIEDAMDFVINETIEIKDEEPSK